MKNKASTSMLLALVLVAGCNPGGEVPGPAVDPLQKVCDELGIATGHCDGVVILSQTGHLDWDWQNWFPTMADGSPPIVNPGYFGCGISCDKTTATCNAPKPTNCIFSAAEQLLTASDRYHYSVCEMAFLRYFANTVPDSFEKMKNSAGLRIVGGGITSPDNLLPHGETFLRNYLVGKTWMDSVGLNWTGQIWLPDDFGHDSQLPTMLQAMGSEGVGFARVPGACDGFGQGGDRESSTATRLLGQISGDPGGVDFFWQANDGSQILAHWMQDHYGQGNNVARGGNLYVTPEDQAVCSNQQHRDPGNPQVEGLISNNKPVSPTPFIYVPVSGDFIMPVGTNGETPDMLQIVDAWNTSDNGNPPNGIAAMVGTFDDYVDLVSQYVEQNPTQTLATRSFHDADRPFEPTPYWMGFYASRPGLKGLHYQTTRTLLAAETFAALPGYVADGFGGDDAAGTSLFEIWNNLVPSTHHDYITGTAIDPVYNDTSQQGKEQLALLKNTLTDAESALSTILSSISSQVPAGEPSVVVFNPLGLSRQGLVEVGDGPNEILVCAQVPSLGYQVQPIGQTCSDLGDVSVELLPNPNQPTTIVLTNKYLKATISKASNWSISSLVDLESPTVEIFSQPANDLGFYEDFGDIYGFGYECDQTFQASPDPQAPVSAVKVEQGDLRIRITTQVTYNSQTFTKQYTLQAGEPMLRMTTSGAAPSNTTVTAGFPLPDAVDIMVHGTPYHWDYKPTVEYRTGATGFNSIFQATHDFVVPQAAGNNLGAVYHGLTRSVADPVTPGIPIAWAVDDKTLLGVVLRNTDGNCNAGAMGKDDGVHSVSYAFRIPGGLPQGNQAATSGTLLQEARQYNTPLHGRLVQSQQGSYPTTFSLASVAQPASAMLTAAKDGTANPDELILRIYQPTNTAQSVQLKLAPALEGQPIRVVTALETPVTEDATAGPSTISAPRAVTTVAIGNPPED